MVVSAWTLRAMAFGTIRGAPVASYGDDLITVTAHMAQAAWLRLSNA